MAICQSIIFAVLNNKKNFKKNTKLFMKKKIIILILWVIYFAPFSANAYSGEYMQDINILTPLEHTGAITINSQTEFEKYFWEWYTNEDLKTFLILLVVAFTIFMLYVEFSKTFRL